MLNVELHVIGGKHSGQVIRLSQKKFLIGREQDCHLRPNSDLVSRHHCIFTVDDYSVRLRDLGSTNGTVVNGEQIRRETTLKPGDHVIVGNLEFELKVNTGAPAAAPASAPAAPPVSAEETDFDAADTIAAMPAVSPEAAAAAADAEAAAAAVAAEPAAEQPAAPPAQPSVEDTAAIAASSTNTPAQPIPQIPAGGSGDTTVIAQQAMLPGQQPYQPMMPQYGQMPQQPYGQYPYGMPQQQMPMYPQQYPGMMPPQQPQYGQMPQQQMPQQAAPAPVEEPEAAPAGGEMQDVSLPDPAETGAKEPPPKPKKVEGAEGGGADEGEKSNESAAAIIQKHMQRRPGG